MKRWIWLSVVSFVLIGLFSMLDIGPEYAGKDFTETDEFSSDFAFFTDRIVLMELDPPQIQENLPVSREEIEEYRNRNGTLAEQLQSIQEQYRADIEEAEASDDSLSEAIREERDRKMAEIRKNFEDDETVIKKIRAERTAEMAEILQAIRQEKPSFLEATEHYVYELTNAETGETFRRGTLQENPYYEKTYTAAAPLRSGIVPAHFTDGTVTEAAYTQSEEAFIGTVQVDRTLLGSSVLGESLERFQQTKMILYTIWLLAAAGIALLLTKLKGKKEWFISLPVYEKWNRLSFEARLLLFLGTGILSLNFISDAFLVISSIRYDSLPRYGQSLLFRFASAFLFTALTVLQAVWFAARYQQGGALKDYQESWLHRSLLQSRQAFLNRSLGMQTVMLLIIVFFWGIGTLLTGIYPEVFIFLWIPASLLIGLPAVLLLLKRTGYLNVLMKGTAAIAEGRLQEELPVRGRSPLAEHARQLNRLKEGVRHSQSEQAKSERLKTELITNVSHDLRTPLTSIITYTDLLKKPGLAEEDRLAYAAILDRKSQRLKTLIEDLFEVSKMATGNMELERQKVDAGQLLQQALAEHAEEIVQSGLEFRITVPEEPVRIYADGQKWWRVLDNLIINALKYAMPGTRVYVSLQETDGLAEFVVKNVTRHEIGGDTEELFERFKRGDTSRGTEGSGLGLAIAQSIVDLHGGRLEIAVDGDLFKVTVTLQSAG